MFVVLKDKKRVDSYTIDTTKPLRCYIHEIDNGMGGEPKHWYLVEAKKKHAVYDSSKDPGVEVLFRDPDFPGFKYPGGGSRLLEMTWLDGDQAQEVCKDIENNEDAIGFLLRDEDYDRID